VAWEFGVHGFKPYNAATVFSRKHGDCKDKTTLLITLLALLDIPAYPAITNLREIRGIEDYSLPMLEHFNHVITYIPPSGDREALFLDATAQYSSIHDFPGGDAGATVLIVKESESGLLTIPCIAPEQNQSLEKCRITLSPDGSATLVFQGEAKGDKAAAIRLRFHVEGNRKSELERMFSSLFPGAKILETAFSDLDDLAVPVTYSYSLHVPVFARKVPEGWSLENIPDPGSLSPLLFAAASLEERVHDLVLPPPALSAVDVTYILPEIFRAKSLPADVEVAEPFGVFRLQYRLEGNNLRVEKIVRFNTTRIAREDYSRFREASNRMILAMEKKIILERVRNRK
jgi:hypothetical protein